MPYPHLLFKTYIEKRQIKSIQEGIEQSCYSETIRVFKEKLRFDPEILCPNITAPLRIAATASLGQITFSLGNSDFTLLYKNGDSENPPA
jgi:hypothetical protein